MKFICTAFCLIFAATVPASAQNTPLLDLLTHIPATADGEIYLADHAAMRAEVMPFAAGIPANDPTVGLLPYASTFSPSGINPGDLFQFTDDGGQAALGFNLLEIDQMAGWGRLPSAPILFTGIANQSPTIESALNQRGFEQSNYNGQLVFHRLDDFSLDLERRNQDPLSGAIGAAQRIAVTGDLLRHTRGWPNMHLMLDGGPTMDTNTDVSAILRAAYKVRGAGPLINAILINEQPIRAIDPSLMIRDLMEPTEGRKTPALPQPRDGLPAFLRYGLLLWQDGATMTGAIAIPYIRDDTAQTALARFTDAMANEIVPSRREPFDDFLPKTRKFGVIDMGQRKVLMLAFRHTFEVQTPLGLRDFVLHPQRRLFDLVLQRDIGMLIGR